MTHSWMMTAADLGLDLERAVDVATFDELDRMAALRGVVGGTFATGEPGYAARRAYAVLGGVLYVSPAVKNVSRGFWPNPGAGDASSRLRTGDEQHADAAADRWERARDRDDVRRF